MEKVCPRCKLPQNGINVCEYCGLIFAKYKKLTFKEKLSQKKNSNIGIDPKQFCCGSN